MKSFLIYVAIGAIATTAATNWATEQATAIQEAQEAKQEQVCQIINSSFCPN